MEKPSIDRMDQVRMRHAWKQIDDAKHTLGNTPRKLKEYVSTVKNTPARIRTAMLGSAVALLVYEGSDKKGFDPNTPQGLVYTALEDWLIIECPGAPFRGLTLSTSGWVLLDAIHQADALQMGRATVEALAYLAWLKVLAATLGKQAAPTGEEEVEESGEMTEADGLGRAEEPKDGASHAN